MVPRHKPMILRHIREGLTVAQFPTCSSRTPHASPSKLRSITFFYTHYCYFLFVASLSIICYYYQNNFYKSVAITLNKTPLHSTAELRRANRNRVFRYLYNATEPVTKQDLARELSMSLPTLTQNLTELLERGLLDNSEIADSTGGRKPRILAVVPDARFAVGAELSPKHIRLVAIDLCVNELAYKVVSRPLLAAANYADGLVQDLETFLDENRLDRSRLLGVGIAVPGIVSADQKTIVSAPTLGIKDLDITRLSLKIPYPTYLTNDANAGGFAEWWRRTPLKSVAYLSLGRGVGGAILVNGVPYMGQRQRSGEFGHMCIHPEGKPCSCGGRGCLEAYCSTALLSDDLGISLQSFFAGLDEGRADYMARWNTYLDDLVVGISNIRTTLDCDVILGGTLTQFMGPWMNTLEERLQRQDPFWDGNRYLHLCRYHGKSNSIGAAMRFTTEFIADI